MDKKDLNRRIVVDEKEISVQEAIEEDLRMASFPAHQSSILPGLQAKGYVEEVKGVWCITQEGVEYQKKLRLGPFRYWASKNWFPLAVLGLTFLALVSSTVIGIISLLRG